MNWVLGIAILLLAFLILEAALLRRAVNGIPCRVLVTGTRGKSSLVKILTAGIRAVEPATWGKITGDSASMLTPDGVSRDLKRRGPAHLREQARFLRHCHRSGARCVVIESMAISPEAMVAESRLVRPSLVVVTNVRDDHRETLGEDRDEQRAAYLASLSGAPRWLTMDAELLSFVARSKRYPEPIPRSRPDDTPGDPHDLDVASELVAVAEAALEALGWSAKASRRAARDAAARLAAPPSVVGLLGHEMTLLDAFSANDPQSLSRLWTAWRRDAGAASRWSVLFSTRADRPLRTRQFCEWIAARGDVDRVFLAGSHVSAAARLLRGSDLTVARVPRGEPELVARVGEGPLTEGERAVLVGIGNARGLGLRLRAASSGGARP